MSETIQLAVELRAFVRRETKRRWVAVCPKLGVASQGESQESAKVSLHEAIELWFESCVERGVLDQALREVNFRPRQPLESVDPEADHVIVRRFRRREDHDVLGEEISIHLTIPAYQAAALSVSA